VSLLASAKGATSLVLYVPACPRAKDCTVSHLGLACVAYFAVPVRVPQTVANAFADGVYTTGAGSDGDAGRVNGGELSFGSGDRGDMAATVAAVLLDREATTPLLDADPDHGSLREPLLKVLHVLRAMEFEPVGTYGQVRSPCLRESEIQWGAGVAGLGR